MVQHIIPLFSILLALLAFASPLKADEATESRARALYHDLRCMVCGGQSLAESNAELAVGMRQMILERLENGESEEKIKSYLTKIYGDEILMTPPLRRDTLFLWLMPLFFIAAGAIGMVFMLRQKDV